MSETFWSNTIWYILLGILTVIELAFALNKVKQKKYTLAFYLTIAGITFSIETLILIYLDSYQYFPIILKNPPTPFDDNLAGNVFSQFSVSATALLFIVFELKFYWIFIIAAIYGCIEELFLALGIYSHNWYRTWMTVLAFPFFLLGVKKMNIKLMQGIKPFYYYGYILLALFPVWIIFFLWGVLQLSELQTYSTTFIFVNPIHSKYSLAMFHFLLFAIPILLIHHFKLPMIWKSLVILSLYLINYLFYKQNIFLFKQGWFFPVTTISLFWMYFAVFILDKYFRTEAKVL